ncbi:MAG TPA: hypothetical protein ACFYD2_04530 [Candidatus Avalokitesvara rifleensis]|uniref:hypothetical protein n=1 Tax=Candidatus Avalokitesvara rifleensis TaxID=3367620 RepID=UPI002713BDC8|nr:hypothetical protein [Candidatus Brocadiales bacterium]
MSEKRKLITAVVAILALNVFTYHAAMDLFFHSDGLANLASFYNPETGRVDRFLKAENLDFYEIIPFLTWYLLYQEWGLNPVPYHITSLVFHIMVCIEVFLLIRFITRRGEIAFLSALLYSVFYLNSQVVLWENSLFHAQALFFSLAGILIFLYSNRTVFTTIVVMVFFSLALMSKGVAMATPLVLTIMCWGLLGSDFKLRHYVPFLVLPVAFTIYSFYGVPSAVAHDTIRGLTHSIRAFTCLLTYATVPFNLPVRKFHMIGALPVLLIFFLLYYLLRSDESRRHVRCLCYLAVIAIMPVSVAGFGYEGRYVYYPCVFTFPVIFIFIYELASRLSVYANLSKMKIVAVVTLVLLISNYCTVQRMILVYRKAGTQCLRDLEAGKLENPRWLIRTQPRLMSPTVWLNGWFYESTLVLYNLEKGREGRFPKAASPK